MSLILVIGHVKLGFVIGLAKLYLIELFAYKFHYFWGAYVMTYQSKINYKKYKT